MKRVDCGEKIEFVVELAFQLGTSQQQNNNQPDLKAHQKFHYSNVNIFAISD